MEGAPVRTKEISIAEVRYAVAYGALNERFWRTIDTSFNLVQICAGALALAGALSNGSVLAAGAGIVVALISGVQLTLSPLQKAIEYRDSKRCFIDLNARAPTLTQAQIDAELERIKQTAPEGLSSLAIPALNIVDRQHGHTVARDLSWHEKLALFLS